MRRFLPVLIASLLFVIPSVARAGDEEKPAKQDEVPKAVSDALVKKFPGAKPSGWEKEGEGKDAHWEAKVEITTKGKDGKETTRSLEVAISVEGKILEEEEIVAAESMPDAVKKAIADSKYAKATVKRVTRVTKEEKADEATYEVAFVMGEKTVEATFDKAGKLLEEEGAEEAKPEQPAMN